MTNESGSAYYTIHEFMTDLLGLRGSKLLVYALIYSFSRDGKGQFMGSREYLAKSTGTSIRTVTEALSELCRGGYVKKFEHPCLRSMFSYQTDYDKIERASKRRTQKEKSKRQGLL